MRFFHKEHELTAMQTTLDLIEYLVEEHTRLADKHREQLRSLKTEIAGADREMFAGGRENE